MLLRLIPDPPHPAILFTLAFTNLPESVPFPANWAQQLQYVLHDELEMPTCVHALDKAAWAVCLLHEVNFCVFSRTIQCIFVDGTRLDLPLEDQGCLDALQTVIMDVQESTIVGEIEQRRARALSAPAAVRPTVPNKLMRHKKTRSFFASFFASLVPTTLSRPSSPTLPQYESEGGPVPPPEPPVSSRFLRKRARACLVDIYRRYVIPELGSPFPSGGYVFWIVQSTLRRIEGRMQALVQEMGGELPLHRLRTTPSRIRLRLSPSALSESPFDDDGSSSSSAAETASDASSVHTPRDSVAEYPVLYRTSNSDDALIRAENGLMAPPDVVSSPIRSQSEDDASARQYDAALQEYTVLHTRNVRLRNLLTRVEVAERNTDNDRAVQLEILEVKSKRRAWSVRSLLGRACADHAGFATPLRSSPLARCAAITPETIANGTWAHGSTHRRMAAGCDDTESALLFSPSYEPVLTRGLIPFPAIDDDGDDFCSTGPQDTLPLFAHPSEVETESEGDEYIEHHAPAHVWEGASTTASCSAVDLPGMLSNPDEVDNACFGAMSSPMPPTMMKHAQSPVSVPVDVFSDAYAYEEASCNEFTLSLGGRDPYAARRGRGGAPSKFLQRDWMVDTPIDCR